MAPGATVGALVSRLLAVTLGLAAGAAPAHGATVVTWAGVESTSASAPAPCWGTLCALPSYWPRTWVATERRLTAGCLTHLPDGTPLLCQGSQLLRLGPDGRLSPWGPGGLGVGWLRDADVTPGGDVVAIGRTGVARVQGATQVTRVGPPPGWRLGSGIAAMPDGSTWFTARRTQSEGSRTGVLRIGSGAQVSIVRRAVPLGGSAAFSVDPFDDLVALPSGSALILAAGERRLRELSPLGRVRIVGRRAGTATTMAVDPRARLVVASDRGLRLGGRRLMRGTDNPYDPVDPRALTIDGRTASSSVLRRAERLDVLPDGTILALVRGANGDTRVIGLAPRRRQARLGVALPASNRRTLRYGVMDVYATRRARAVIEIRRGARVLVRVRTSLRRGHNRLALRGPAADGALIAHVRASARGGVATHRLAFVPRWQLAASELHVIRRLVEEWGSLASNALTFSKCLRISGQAFRCRMENWGDGTLLARGWGTFTLERDGLVHVAMLGDASDLVYEPRPVP